MVQVTRKEFINFIKYNNFVGTPIEAETLHMMQYTDRDGHVVADAIYNDFGSVTYRIVNHLS